MLPGGPSKRDVNQLIKQANAPISNLLQIRFQDSYAPVFEGADGQGNTFSIAAVVPIRRLNVFPTTQVALLTVPAAVTVPGGLTGFGDIRLLDLVVVAERSDLVLGVGPTFVFPSASERLTGQGKWQLGPAVGIVYPPTDLLFGVIAQNPISFAGDPTAPRPMPYLCSRSRPISLDTAGSSGQSHR